MYESTIAALSFSVSLKERDCFALMSFYDGVLLDLLKKMLKTRIRTPDEIPLVLKELVGRGVLDKDDYKRIVGLLLEIDGLIEARINNEIDEEECKKGLKEKYREILSIITQVTTNWEQLVAIRTHKEPTLSPNILRIG